MKLSLQKPSLETIQILILNKNEKKAYRETMNIKRNRVYTTKWKTMNEVIEPEFLKIYIKNVRIMKMKLLICQLR